MNRDTWVRVRVTPEERAAFKEFCDKEGCTMSGLIRQHMRESVTFSEQTEWI